ncbi:MAG: gamma-glutamyltransferase [Gammaproteobacteria bacterium]|nr:gamma-glutamyltransferase [Gammaproteobacteria bacterium]
MPRLLAPVIILLLSIPAHAAHPPAAAIASAHPLATDAGMEILNAGGNAFDAAVAVTGALAVVAPMSCGLGGGGFWLLHRAKDNFETMIDGRETAPQAARNNMYLDEQGNVVPNLSLDGPLSAAIPGTPAALVHLAKKYGRLPLARSLAPAIRLAHDGFATDEFYRRVAEFRLTALANAPGLLEQGKPPQPGFVLRQPDLAAVLISLAKQGTAGFYHGEVASKLVDGVRHAGGIWTLNDLANYKIIERTPLRGEYHGTRITSAPPPSSGGVALMSMLNILSGYPLTTLDASTQTHLLIEAMRRAYRDRAEYLGDPGFVSVPVKQLLHPFYAAGLRASIRLDRATPSSALPTEIPVQQGPDTTHFSILDRDGNRVAATVTVNYAFGSAFIPPGTGVLLNDEMDDFSAKPGAPNAYGLVGAEANAIAPGKRPLSSMTPTFLENQRGVAILGTPGGSRIISMVLLATLEFARGGNAANMVALPRLHHQFVPDQVFYEADALNPGQRAMLEKRGHRLEQTADRFGDMQAIVWERDTGVNAASDPRGRGAARVQNPP